MRVVALLASLLGLIGCAPHASRDGAVAAAIDATVTQRLAAGGGAIGASKLLPGEWDRAEVAGPYTPAAAVVAKTGPDGRIEGSGIEARDDITLLILLKGGTILSVVELPRGTADFSPLAGSSLVPEDCLVIHAGQPPRVERGTGC